MGSFRKAMALALTYTGAIIGAGFASGQELVHFFVRQGFLGLLGTVVATVGFVVSALTVFKIGVSRGITSYHRFLIVLLGENLGRAADLCFSCYLFMGLVIMLAGCESVFSDNFGFAKGFGLILSSLILIGALLRKEGGVLALNTFLVPLIIFGALLISISSFRETGLLSATVNSGRGFAWLGFAILYVSYNMIGGLVILLRFTGSHYREGFFGIVLGGLVLGVLAGLLSLVLLNNYSTIAAREIPLLVLAENRSIFLGRAYGIALWFAMLTTAVVDGAALALRMEKAKLPYLMIILLFIFAAALLAKVGFSVLIKTVYPFFGYLGLVLLMLILLRWCLKKQY
ncbi:MAG: hypothetical protein WDA53_03150 [Bacillota bacterium]